MSTTRLWNRMNAAVRLRDREVLVVSRVGDDRLADRARGLSRQVRAWRAALRRAQLQMDAVGLVELRRGGILGAVAVQRVEVEARRARLEERRRRDVGALHQPALVEGQVMVEELAEVREPGRDLPRRGCRPSSPGRSSAGWAYRAACRSPSAPCARSGTAAPSRARTQRALPASARLPEEPLADDEVGFRTVPVHVPLPLVNNARAEAATRHTTRNHRNQSPPRSNVKRPSNPRSSAGSMHRQSRSPESRS